MYAHEDRADMSQKNEQNAINYLCTKYTTTKM